MIRLFSVSIILSLCASMALAQDKEEEVKKEKQEKPAVEELKSPVVVAAPQVVLTLADDLEFTGAPVDLDSIAVNAVFGEVDVPLSTIAGIRFASDENERTTVALLNGDSLTGVITISDYKLNTTWGQATVQAHAIQSITMVPGMKWMSESAPGGIRWKLTRSTSATSPSRTPVISTPIYRNR